MKKTLFKFSDYKKLPSSIGVYIFRDKNKKALYIGKSINIKARVLSHINAAKLSTKEKRIIEESKYIEVYILPSEYSALILEAELIRKERPKYNKIWQDDKSYLYIKITNEEFPKIYPVRKSELKNSLFSLGPFSSLKVVNNILRSIRKVFPFCSQKKLGKRVCFYSKLNLCNPCPSEINQIKDNNLKKLKKQEYLKNIKGAIKLLKGNVELIKKHFYKKLEDFKKQEKFEEAIKLREQIKSLEHLSLLSFENQDYFSKTELWDQLSEFLKKNLKIKTLKRIECYDISRLKNEQITASLVVMKDSMLDKSEYRRFKIKIKKNLSDPQILKQVILRRFKNKWEKPDLILIDGGKPQIKAVLEALNLLKLKVKVLGLAKNPDRVVILKDNKTQYIRGFSRKKYLNLLRLLRDEAHRFAKKYHLLLRKRKFLV